MPKYPSGPAPNQTGKAVYIGVDQGSDLEVYGYQTRADPAATTGPASFARRTAPRYKVGYINSDKFAEEMMGLDPNVVENYQKFMYDAGLLKKFTPGRLDKPTRNAFKELMSSANQKGTRWQDELGTSIAAGGIYDPEAEEERAPFVAELTDPVALRETFQSAVQKIYGGDLPDAEVQAMVDAFRSQQLAKQQAAYNMAETGGIAEGMTDASSFAEAHVKEKHPQQLDRVKFADTFSGIMDTFRGGAQ